MSDFAQFQSICPVIANAGSKAAQIAKDDKTIALAKLSDLSATLIKIIFHFEGLGKSGETLPTLTMMNRLINRGLMPSNLILFFQTLRELGGIRDVH